MPDPNYAGNDAPGFLHFLIGAIILFVLLLTMKSCF